MKPWCSSRGMLLDLLPLDMLSPPMAGSSPYLYVNMQSSVRGREMEICHTNSCLWGLFFGRLIRESPGFVGTAVEELPRQVLLCVGFLVSKDFHFKVGIVPLL